MATITRAFGTPIILAASGFSPTAGTSITGTRTHLLTLTSLAANAYRQSEKADFGATPVDSWFVQGAFTPTSAPAAYGIVEVFIGYSSSATAANNNPGNLSGSDAAYTGYGGAATDADEMVYGELERIGSVMASADADTFVGDVGIVVPKQRYFCIVVRNSLSVALSATVTQMGVYLTPITTTIS